MKLKKLIFPFLVALLISSCKKDLTVSPETISLLQNRWTLISSRVTFPDNSTLNSTYKGVPADYYIFGTNDSLKIKQAGQVNVLHSPLSVLTKYSFVDNNTLRYSPNPTISINIQTLTENLLVLTNPASATFINADYSVTTFNGLKTDSLSR